MIRELWMLARAVPNHMLDSVDRWLMGVHHPDDERANWPLCQSCSYRWRFRPVPWPCDAFTEAADRIHGRGVYN